MHLFSALRIHFPRSGHHIDHHVHHSDISGVSTQGRLRLRLGLRLRREGVVGHRRARHHRRAGHRFLHGGVRRAVLVLTAKVALFQRADEHGRLHRHHPLLPDPDARQHGGHAGKKARISDG